MKKIISILLSVCLLSGIMLLPVSANTTPIATGADGKVELTYYGGMGLTGDNASNPTFIDSMANTICRYNNRTSHVFETLPTYLAGTTYLQLGINDYQTDADNDGTYDIDDYKSSYMTLKLYNSATVYYLTQHTNITEKAQPYMTEWLTYDNAGWITNADGSASSTTASQAYANSGTGNSANTGNFYVFKFDIEASAEQPYTLDIKGKGIQGNGDTLNSNYTVAFDWKAEDEESVIAKDTLGNVELTTYMGTSGTATFADSMSINEKRYHDRDAVKFSEAGFPAFLNGTTFLQTGINDWQDASGTTAVIDDYTQTFMSFKIYESATVYYITQHTAVSDVGQPYINAWFADTTKKNAGWMTGETHTNALGELEYTYSTDGSDAKVWTTGCGTSANTKEIYVFKFEIEASKESPYILDVAGKGTFPNGGSLNSLYTLAFDWHDEETNSITVNAGANGTASVTGTHSVVTGHTVPLTITADKGYIIDSATVNGVPQVVSGDSASLNVTVSEDTVVDVVFAAIEMPEELTTYTQNVFVSASETFMDGNNEVTSPAGVLFAKAGEAYGEMERTSCGMIFSKTPMTIDEVKGGTKGEQAQAEGTHANGNFGIRFYGAGIVNGNTYYAVPYAVYTDGVTTTTLYGTEVLTFTIPME